MDLTKVQEWWVGSKKVDHRYCPRCEGETPHTYGSKYWFCIAMMGDRICGRNNYCVTYGTPTFGRE